MKMASSPEMVPTTSGHSALSTATATLAAALSSSRMAICQLEGELEAILTALRDPTARPDEAAADRLRGAARAADAAIASLGAFARR